MAKRSIPAGVKDAVVALAIDGKTPKREIARKFGLDVQTVRRLAAGVKDLDPGMIDTLKRSLPRTLTILAAGHAARAIESLDDPQASVRHTFGAKLAVEAARVAQPSAETPGATVLTF